MGRGGGWPGSAAVVKPQALRDLPAAQRAGAQGLAALVAAADVAAVEEDHLGLRRDRGSVWVLPLPVLGNGPAEPPGPLVILYLKNHGHYTASERTEVSRDPLSWTLHALTAAQEARARLTRLSAHGPAPPSRKDCDSAEQKPRKHMLAPRFSTSSL